jgi:predicted nucleic acid-binding protein
VSVFVDSDILIDVLRARDPGTLSSWHELAMEGTGILYSPVSAAEVWTGARINEGILIDRLFRPMICIPIGHETGHLAGNYLRQFSKSHGLRIGDALIAAEAMRQKAELWTRNRKHYPMAGITFYQ